MSSDNQGCRVLEEVQIFDYDLLAAVLCRCDLYIVPLRIGGIEIAIGRWPVFVLSEL